MPNQNILLTTYALPDECVCEEVPEAASDNPYPVMAADIDGVRINPSSGRGSVTYTAQPEEFLLDADLETWLAAFPVMADDIT